MSYGLQISASGLFTAMYRQDVYANNLANVQTPGFKVDTPVALARQAVRPEDGVWDLPSNALLERLGGGVLMHANETSFAQGPLQTSTSSTDLAIQGPGFFVVQDGSTQRFTRDGRFMRDAQGLLVTSQGLPVLGDNGPIHVPDCGKLQIDPTGVVRADGAECARLRLVDVPDTAALAKSGQGLFTAPPEALAAATPARGSIKQYAYEGSGTDEVTTLMDMTAASRDVEANVEMLRTHDRLMDRAINTLGRV